MWIGVGLGVTCASIALIECPMGGCRFGVGVEERGIEAWGWGDICTGGSGDKKDGKIREKNDKTLSIVTVWKL